MLNLYMNIRGWEGERGDDKSCFVLKSDKASYFPWILNLNHWMTDVTTKYCHLHREQKVGSFTKGYISFNIFKLKDYGTDMQER